MPWHLSKSDPRKVYDERHEVVCVCQTAEQSARIVAAVTGKAQEVIRLREPVLTPGTAKRDQCYRCGRTNSDVDEFIGPRGMCADCDQAFSDGGAVDKLRASPDCCDTGSRSGGYQHDQHCRFYDGFKPIARDGGVVLEAGGPTVPLDSFEPDTCCGPAISKAARSGVLRSVTSWECPKCGMEWQPAQVGSIRHWSHTPAVMIFRR